MRFLAFIAAACLALLIVSRVQAQEESPRDYLYRVYPDHAERMDCVIRRESEWNPSATNPTSGAAGLAQFVRSTWLSTPEGKAGYSPYEPFAAIDAAIWLATNVGYRQWSVVYPAGLC